MPDTTPPEAPLAPLSERIGHPFARPELLQEALTHRSLHNERPKQAPRHNERLEFLGDAFIGAAVARLVFDAYPGEREGALTRRRAELVSESGLAEVARTLSLGEDLRLGKGEERSGGRTKPRLLASAFEAVVGAILLDAGPDAALTFCRGLFGPRVADAEGKRDAKSLVQERLQADGRGTPRYEVVDTSGPDHERVFQVALVVDSEPDAADPPEPDAEASRQPSPPRDDADARGSEDADPGVRLSFGEGRSKAEAAQRAAEAALVLLGQPRRGGQGEETTEGG